MTAKRPGDDMFERASAAIIARDEENGFSYGKGARTRSGWEGREYVVRSSMGRIEKDSFEIARFVVGPDGDLREVDTRDGELRLVTN